MVVAVAVMVLVAVVASGGGGGGGSGEKVVVVVVAVANGVRGRVQGRRERPLGESRREGRVQSSALEIYSRKTLRTR